MKTGFKGQECFSPNPRTPVNCPSGGKIQTQRENL